MRPKLFFAVPMVLLCWVLVAFLPISAAISTEAFKAARELCMDGGQLLLTTVAVIDLRLALAVSLPPLLLGSTALITCLLRTRKFTSELLNGQVQPLPVSIKQLETQLDIVGRLHVVESVEPFAFCAGLLRPRIFLSKGLLDRLAADELDAVLRHEAWHVRRHDPLITALCLAAGRALFLLPRSGELVSRLLATRELRADDATIAAMGTPYPLASALHKALRWSRAPVEMVPGGFSALDARIDRLLAYGDAKPGAGSRWALATSLVVSVALVLIVCGVAAVAAAASAPSYLCGTC